MAKVFLFSFLAFLLLVPILVPASSADELPVFLGKEVVVSATRLPQFSQKLSRIPSNVTVIDSEDIKKSGATNLPEVLNQYEGVIVADSLGFGLEANLGMRGFGGEAKNVLVLVDGVRISEAFDNTLFWKLIPLQQIERVEIVRGGVSSVYGGGALAGVINVITKKGAEKLKTDASISLGNFGQQKYHISSAGPMGDWQYLVNLGKEQFDGYRINSEHNETTIMAKLSRELGKDKSLEINFNNHQSASGIAGGITKEAMLANPRQMNEAALETDGFSNRLSLYSLNYNHGLLALNLFTSTRQQDSVMTGAWGASENFLQTNSTGGVIQFSNILFTGGIEYRKDQVENPGTWNKKAINRDIWGAFLENNMTWNKLSMTLGARGDHEEINLIDRSNSSKDKLRRISAISPKMGFVFTSSKAASLFANLSQSFKAPESNAMLFEAVGLFSSNPDIEPTTATHIETGFRLTDQNGSEVKVSLYSINSKREILYNGFASPWGQNENFDTLRKGLELALKKQLSQKIFWSTTYTLSQAIFWGGQFDAKKIPLSPDHKYTAQIDYKMFDNLNLSLDWLGINGQFALNDFNNLYPVDAYSIFNSRISFEKENYKAYLSARNLFDEKYSAYVSSNAAGLVRYNPAPGRSWTAGFSLEL